ncbi:hypothetical protein T4D_9012 [Trichinella pseudospiralis]|uniref:Uncharacterized protein n=1 Tax=Trichinella pseudospiralis TaxID=6337 RepID=A0A0V1FIK8_TRIPS|nr:hypothetical protein T4D_9012 [Trichinella pseudospiralis]
MHNATKFVTIVVSVEPYLAKRALQIKYFLKAQIHSTMLMILVKKSSVYFDDNFINVDYS